MGRGWGTEPELRERLMIDVMRGKIIGRQFLTKPDGMKLRAQVEVFVPVMTMDRRAGEIPNFWLRA